MPRQRRAPINGGASRRSTGTGDDRVDALRAPRGGDAGLRGVVLALELNGPGYARNRQRTESVARPAMTGAVPVPCPPRRPVVTNTMSAPSSTSIGLSVSSSAALRLTFDRHRQPRPLYQPAADPDLVDADLLQRLQVGVGEHELDATQSRPHHPSTASLPPPPMPTTSMRAPARTLVSSVRAAPARRAGPAPRRRAIPVEFIDVHASPVALPAWSSPDEEVVEHGAHRSRPSDADRLRGGAGARLRPRR